jgi:uncharacterized membrane protein YhaH (DUF805 family)
MRETALSFLSFKGRIGRATFAVRFVILTAYVIALAKLVPGFLSSGNTVRELIEVFALFLFIWCTWANSAKRWHDTNRSSVYAFLMIVPAVGAALNLVLNLAMEGTSGPNRFGPPALK